MSLRHFLAAASTAAPLTASTLVEVDFSHLSHGAVIGDGDRIEDVSGNGHHGFWGDAAGTYPVVATASGVALDTTASTRGHIFLRDGLDAIPDSWDGPTTTVTPYFIIDGGTSYTFEAVVNWNGTSSSTNGLMGQTGSAECWIRENGGFLQYTFTDGTDGVSLFDTSIDLTAAKGDSAWHSIALVYDAGAGEIRSYLDGALLHTLSDSAIGTLGACTSGTADFRLGAYNTSDPAAFNGLQTHYRISEAVLTPAEMLQPPPPGDTPIVTSVTIEGLATVGETLTGSYQYSDPQGDPEGTSTFRWFRSADPDFDAGDLEIPGSTTVSHTLLPEDIGFHLFLEVTPEAASGPSPGTPVVSSPSPRVLAPGPFPESIPFTSGIGYPVYRIPAIVKATDGTLLAFCEGRASISDAGNIDLVLRRSTDHGNTWGPLIVVQEEGGTAPITIGNPTPIVDHSTGHIHLLFTRENDTVFHTVSADHGLTWSERVEITPNVKLPSWGWYATGPCHGVQLTRGAQAGRLVAPANHRIGANGSDSGSFGAQVLYSDDHGATWHMDVYADGANGTAPNETTLVELNTPGVDGGSHVYINSRDYGSDPGNRSEAYSGDGGSSYSVPYDGNPHFVTPIVQGSLLRFSATDEGDAVNRILFSCPNGGSRSNGAIWVSYDETSTWSAPKPLFADSPRDFAYSDMVKADTGELGLLYETDNYGTIRFARISEAWLDAPPPPVAAPRPALWLFEEKDAGENVDPASGALLDRHPDGHALHLTTQSGSIAYTPGAESSTTALDFDGSGGLAIADGSSGQAFDFGPEDSVTFEARLRIPAASTSLPGAILAKNQQPGGEWWLRVQTGGTVTFLWDDGANELTVSSTTAIDDGEWHHVAAVRDAVANELRLYIDGVLEGTTPDVTTGDIANGLPLTVGAFNGTAGRNLVGTLDWVAITPSALAPGGFVHDRLMADSDLDALPDADEFGLAGNLTDLGSGDFDRDGAPDLLEIALGSDPLTASPPGTPAAGTAALFSYQRRSDVDWLSFDEQFSDDLIAWGIAPASLLRTVSPLTSGLESVGFTGSPDLPASRLFFRVAVSSVFP